MKGKKLNLRELIWFAFNITCGITVIFAIPGIFNTASADLKGQNLGLNVIWILIIEGIVGFIVSVAFAKLNENCINSDGGSYNYARTFFPNRSWLSLLIGYFLYGTVVFAVTSQIVSLLRLNFGANTSYPIAHSPYANLYLDLIGVAIFLVGSLVVWKGYAIFKTTFIISSIVKWTLTLLVLISCLAMTIINFSNGQAVNLHQRSHLPGVTGTINLFLTIFFFFAGFEIYSTLSENLKRPKRDLSIALCCTMVLVTLFYLLVFVSFMGIMTQKNPNLSKNPFFKVFGNRHRLQLGMNIMAIIGFITTKLLASVETSFYANSVLSPLAKDQFIPLKVADEKQHLSRHAISLNLLTILLLFLMIVILPDLVAGIDGSGKTQIHYQDIIEISSLISALIYLFVLATNFYLGWKRKLHLHWLWWTAFALVSIFMITEVIFYFVNIGVVFQHDEYVKGAVITSFMIIYLSIYLGYYFFYLRPHLTKLKKSNPALLVQLQKKYAYQKKN